MKEVSVCGLRRIKNNKNAYPVVSAIPHMPPPHHPCPPDTHAPPKQNDWKTPVKR